MVIKRLTNLFLLREGILTSDFDSEKSSFLSFDGCSVVWQLTFPFSLPSFSLPFLYSSFLFTLESSFSSDSSDLWVKWKKKKILMVLQGIKVWSLSGLSSGSSLKFALSRLINFLISHNNIIPVKQQFIEKKENHQTTRYPLSEHHILKDIVITLVWQTAKRIYLNILEAKGLIPLRGPMLSFLPKLFLNIGHYPLILWHGMCSL